MHQQKIGKIVPEGKHKTIGVPDIRICNLFCPEEAAPGDTVNFSLWICNRYEHSVDFKTELITFWNRSAITKYGTALPKPPDQLESLTVISGNFTMPDKPAIYAPVLFIKEDEKWTYKHRFIERSIVPPETEPFVWDYFSGFSYPFVCKTAEFDDTIKFSVAVTFENLGTLQLWQQVGVHVRWVDEWLWSPIVGLPTQGRGGFGFHCDVYEMPEEDAIIDFHLRHSEDSSGPWETGVIKTATVKPVSDFGPIDITNVKVPYELLPNTKPDYFDVSATVSHVKKFFFLVKDQFLVDDVANVLILEEEAEGDITININPDAFFIKTMPNRDWSLSLRMAAEEKL